MKKPRVFIAIHYMELGGAEAALAGMLQAWDYNRADLDLFVYSHRGELMDMIPAEVNLLPEKRSYSCIESPISETLRKGCLGVALGRWLGKRSFSRFYLSSRPQPNYDAAIAHLGKAVCPFLPGMSSRVYDLAISFLTPHFYVLRKVKARRKVCWIHTDYSYTSADVSIEEPMWSAFDSIVSISPAVTEAFCKLYPTLRNKITEIGNIMPVDFIRARAEEGYPPEFDPAMFNILSVGRFAEPKNFVNIPAIMRRVVELTGRTDLRWWIIGYGGLEEQIRAAISKQGMEESVRILGKRSNPYPYIKACSLYAQPSLFEGKSVTVREAQALGRPVVISRYATSASQLEDGVDGLILPMDNEGFATALASVINDTALLSRLAATCSGRDYSDRAEVEKIYSLIPDPQ